MREAIGFPLLDVQRVSFFVGIQGCSQSVGTVCDDGGGKFAAARHTFLGRAEVTGPAQESYHRWRKASFQRPSYS